MPCFASQFRVAVVFFEKTDRFAVSHTYDNLSLLTILTRRTVRFNQVDVILCVRHSHRTRFRSHPRHGSQCHSRFSLSESLHHLNTSFFFKLIEYCRIERFTSRGAVLQRREIVFREVFTNHEAIDGRRRTERSDVVFLYLSEQRISIEFLMIEHKHGSSGKPLSVEFAPYRLTPSRISNSQME